MMYCDIRNKENYIMTIVTLDVKQVKFVVFLCLIWTTENCI